MITIRCKVLTKEKDICGYSTIVFKNLDEAPFGHKYIMTVVFPNWQSYIPEIGESGFLTYNEVIAGKNTWFDRETGMQVPYNYTNIIFIKFVKEVDSSTKEVML